MGPRVSARGAVLRAFGTGIRAPFLKAMPDRKLDAMGDLASHWFGTGNYVCETGWPNMRLTVSQGEMDGARAVRTRDPDAVARLLARRRRVDPRELGFG